MRMHCCNSISIQPNCRRGNPSQFAIAFSIESVVLLEKVKTRQLRCVENSTSYHIHTQHVGTLIMDGYMSCTRSEDFWNLQHTIDQGWQSVGRANFLEARRGAYHIFEIPNGTRESKSGRASFQRQEEGRFPASRCSSRTRKQSHRAQMTPGVQ